MKVTYWRRHLGLSSSTAAGGGARTKPPFDPVGHDHRVLHLLRLHQAQHLGAVVLRRSDQRMPPRATIRRAGGSPPCAASRRRSRTAGCGFGISGTRAERSLKLGEARAPARRRSCARSPRSCRAGCAGCCPGRGRSPREVGVDRLPDLVDLLLGGGPSRVELRLEQAHQPGRDVRVRPSRRCGTPRCSAARPHPVLRRRAGSAPGASRGR